MAKELPTRTDPTIAEPSAGFPTDPAVAQMAHARPELKVLRPNRQPEPRQSQVVRSPWIVDPIFDLLFIAGGLPLLLILINYLVTGWNGPKPFPAEQSRISALLLGLTLIGQHLFADSHNVATHLRIWGSSEDRSRFRFYRTWLVALFVPLFIFGLCSAEITGLYVYIFIMAVFWHYAAQSYGIALIYCMKRGYFLRPLEKRLVKLCMTSLSAFAILRMLSLRQFSPFEWYGVPLPFWGPFPPIFYRAAGAVFALSLLAFSAMVLFKLVREKKLIPLPSLLVLIAVIALGLSEGSANSLLWFYIPPFFHGTQYLAIYLTYALKERGEFEGISTKSLFLSPVAGRLFATSVVVGAFLYAAIPHFFQQFGYSYPMVAGLVIAIVNFHHFFTDAAIWKLRDPHCRELLLS